MKSSTIQERKRFAADLAERDAIALTRGRPGSSDARVDQVADRASGTCEQKSADRPGRRSGAGTLAGASSREPLPPTSAEVLQAYRMRRYWLDRFTLDEIRDLAAGLVHLERAA